MNINDIQIRDPFILPIHKTGIYYLFGTTDKNCWEGPGTGFDCYRSTDLNIWEGPIPAFRPPAGFWATTNFWAPEVYEYHDQYYMFATFKAPEQFRGTQILVADIPEGPYLPLTDNPITPRHWECLDGTLYIDPHNNPWLVFCHEWVQIHDGAIYALPLSPDLRNSAGRPLFLFNASEAPWTIIAPWTENNDRYPFPCYVADGPYLHTLNSGSLIMLWSSMGSGGYTLGIARSTTNCIEGPWVHISEPLWSNDGGHGMLFRTFDGKLILTLHSPGQTPLERTKFIPVDETTDLIQLHQS